MKSENWEKLESDFRDYLSEAHPLIIEAELLYGAFPTAVLNEIRAFVTHVSRCVSGDLDDEQIKIELNRASRHMNRIKLDLYKYVIIGLQTTYYDEFLKSTKTVKLHLINNGAFLVSYNKIYKKAFELTKKAKIDEGMNREHSIPSYIEALSAWRELQKFHDSNLEGITNARLLHRKDTLKKIGYILLGAAITAVLRFILPF